MSLGGTLLTVEQSASPLRAAVYGRESHANAMSIDGQVELGVELVDDLGWTLVRTYDDGGSASRFARKPRPDWEQLVKDLNAGLIDVLVLNEVSRGDRKAGAGLTVLDACRERGVLVHVISDDTTYDPRKVRQWKALADAFIDADAESSRTSEQVTRGVARAAKRGHPPMGVTPYGYMRTRRTERDADGRLVTIVEQFEDPATAHVPREMITKCARSVPIAQIKRDLLEKYGLDWGETRIRDMIRNPAYIGRRRHRRQGRRGNQEQLFDGNWPPLIDEVTFWAAQRVLDTPKRAVWPYSRPGKQAHLVSYLATCAAGHPLNAKKNHWYRCGPGCVQVVMDELDEFVTAATLETLADPEIYARLRAAGQTSDAEVRKAHGEAAALRARLDEYRQRARTGAIDADDFAEISAGLKTDIAAAEKRAAAAGLPPALRPFLEPGADIEARWKDSTLQAKRDVIRTLFTITVCPSPSRVGRRGAPLAERVRIEPKVIGQE